MSVKDLEAQIALEYSAFHAWIAIHPTVSVILALVVGLIIGHFL